MTARGAVTGAAQGAGIPWAPLAGVIATVAVFAIAQGLSYPLLSFILERQGHSSTAIGLSAAMMPVGLIASAAFIPMLTSRFGPAPLGLTCALSAAILMALIGWTQDLLLWFPLRFLIGAVIGPLYVLSEVWIIALSPPEKRGRILGIYSSVISAGFALGPLSLVIVGTEGWAPFLVGIFSFLACFLCLALTARRLPRFDQRGEGASVRAFLPLAPLLLFAVAISAGSEQILFSLLPVYGVTFGVGAAEMSAVITGLVSGSILLQLPLGLAAERWGARTVSLACAFATALGCLVLPIVFATPFVWPFVFVWGALCYGIYTVAIVELGERFSGGALVAGNAAFALMWGVGGIGGPPLAGAAMDWLGANGLPLTLGAMCLGLAVARLVRLRRP